MRDRPADVDSPPLHPYPANICLRSGPTCSTAASAISYAVSVRTRETGIRLALGAHSTNVRALIIRQGLLLTGVGLAVGLAGALLATPVLQSMLINLPATDLVTFVGVSALLIAIALVACMCPRDARRESIRLRPFAPSRRDPLSRRGIASTSPVAGRRTRSARAAGESRPGRVAAGRRRGSRCPVRPSCCT